MELISNSSTTIPPAKLADCPHCGCPIYTLKNDKRGLPIPEYICECHKWARMNFGPTPVWSERNTNPPRIGDNAHITPTIPTIAPSTTPWWNPYIGSSGTIAPNFRNITPILCPGDLT